MTYLQVHTDGVRFVDHSITITERWHLQRRTNEPLREKTNNLEFRPDPTQTGLYSHRSKLDF